jgi:hypothetical protein
MNNLRPAAWMVTDERGFESLHKQEAQANNYLTHVRGGIIDPLVKLRDVEVLLDDGEGADP